MATKTITTTWGFDTGEFGGILSKGDYDRYMAASISGINDVLNSSGIPANAKITNVKCTATLKAENKTSMCEARLKIGFGSGSGISNTLLDTVTIFSYEMSGSTTRTVDLSSVIGNNGLSPFQLNTSKGTHLVWNIWIDNVGKKRYQISNIYFDVTYEEPKTYKLVFDANGGSSIYDGQILEEEYETAITLGSYGFTAPKVKFSYEGDGGTLSTSSVEYHRPFLGWEDLGRIVDPGGTVQTADTFDAPFYANTQADLYAAFGYDKYALLSHYYHNGKNEGRPCINTEGDKTRGVYPDGATVNHLTNINGETVTLRCQWGAVSGNLLPAPTKEGCEFLGWSDGTTTFAAGTTVTSKVDKTFTAQWKKLTCTLTVKSNSDAYGTVTGGGTYENGATATLTATPKTGYKFVKWNDGYTSATRTFKVVADATYIAIFEGITYYVAFDGNDATSGSVATITAKYGTNFTLPENGFTKTITVTWVANGDGATLEYRDCSQDCPFNGWKFGLNASTVYSPGEKIANMSTTDGATVTCYADWGPRSFTYPTATRPGYKFTGWNTKADGTGTPYTATGVETYSNMTLYAQWEKTYTITASGENGTVTGDIGTFEYMYSAVLTATPNPGYKFVKWIVNGRDYGDTQNPYRIAVNQNLTIIAVFEKLLPEFTSITITRSTDLAKVTIDTPVDAGAKYIISVEVT